MLSLPPTRVGYAGLDTTIHNGASEALCRNENDVPYQNTGDAA